MVAGEIEAAIFLSALRQTLPQGGRHLHRPLPIPLRWRGGGNSKGIYDGVVLPELLVSHTI